MAVNWKLKEKIADKFLTQYAFANEVGINETFVSKIVRGARDLDKTGKKIWADVLNCKVEDIF